MIGRQFAGASRTALPQRGEEHHSKAGPSGEGRIKQSDTIVLRHPPPPYKERETSTL